jgi:hypothetical protein
MRLAALWFLLLAAGSALADKVPTKTAAPATAPADKARAKRAAQGTRLAEETAGVYWLPYETCEACEKPEAIVAYVVQTPAAAKEIVKALEGKLPLGLPYIIHTDELGMATRGIAVVTGAFSTLDDANAAVQALPVLAKTKAKARALADEAFRGSTDAIKNPRHATVVDRGAPVPAWSASDVKAVETAAAFAHDQEAQETLESSHRWVLRELGKKKPACMVNPGDVFVVEDKELKYYELAPVRCAGKLAYIDWTHSLLGHAVVINDGGGKFRLRQIVGASCDSPIIEEWAYDKHGRHRNDKKPTLLTMGGCGD